MSKPEIAIVVSSYQRPTHLRRCLKSLMLQRGLAGRFEVVVADDGSTDETSEVVRECANQADFPIKFTTHAHRGFQLSRTRNEGIRATTAPYLLFVDCDCLLPPDHVLLHLKLSRPQTVMVGDCYRLEKEVTESIDEASISSQQYVGLASASECRRIRVKAFKDQVYGFLNLSHRPRLTGNNIGIARTDLELVNGFDESFVGWGLEDRDLQRRLALAGLKFRSILHQTATYHLWHEPVESFSRNNLNTLNLEYFRRGIRSPVCSQGLLDTRPFQTAKSA